MCHRKAGNASQRGKDEKLVGRKYNTLDMWENRGAWGIAKHNVKGTNEGGIDKV